MERNISQLKINNTTNTTNNHFMRDRRVDYPHLNGNLLGLCNFPKFSKSKLIRVELGIQVCWLHSPAQPSLAFCVLSPTPWLGYNSWLDKQTGVLWTPTQDRTQPNSREATGPSSTCPLAPLFSLSLPYAPRVLSVWESLGTKKRDFIKLYTPTILNPWALIVYPGPVNLSWVPAFPHL